MQCAGLYRGTLPRNHKSKSHLGHRLGNFAVCSLGLKVEISITEVAGSVIGWKAVAAKVGRTAHYLAQANAQGRLPIEPLRLGAQVAYTREMVESLRLALEARAAAHQRRVVRAEEAATT